MKQVWKLNNGRPGSNFFQVFGEKPILIKLQPGVFVPSFGCAAASVAIRRKFPMKERILLEELEIKREARKGFIRTGNSF